MRNKLSYYSVLMLVALAMVSGLVFVMNPFNGPPANASPLTQGLAAVSASTSTSTSSTSIPSMQGGNAPIVASQPGGSLFGGHQHREGGGFSGLGGGNSTVTTTSTSAIQSRDD